MRPSTLAEVAREGLGLETIDVLLMESDLQDAVLVQLCLGRARHARFRVRHVSRLAQLDAMLEVFTPQVVLLDYFLPDGWGVEALARVRGAVGEAPIVLLTDFDHPDVAPRFEAWGAAGRVGKGIDDLRRIEDALLDAVATHRIGAMLASA